MTIALIDGDEVAYWAAHRYQQKSHLVFDDGGKLLFRSHDKTEAIEFIENNETLILSEIITPKNPENLPGELADKILKIKNAISATDVRIYLNGPYNFRYGLATILPYKGNRGEEDTKPIFLNYIKNLLRLYYKTESVDYLESDDLLSINYFKNPENSVICSRDKDLRTLPCRYFNIDKEEYKVIDEHEARYNFYTQLLLGDATDNIPSPNQLGPMAAKKILEKLYGKSEQEYYWAVYNAYKEYLPKRDKEGNYRTKWLPSYLNFWNVDKLENNYEQIHTILYEIGNLLYMRRKQLDNQEVEMWIPPL